MTASNSDFGFRISDFRRPQARGYTLIELFVTIAVLIIVLGLAVDMANQIRRSSADKLTRQLLRQLTLMMDSYIQQNNGQLPALTPFLTTDTARDDPTIQLAAHRNNADFIRLLRGEFSRPKSTTQPGNALSQDIFAGLPLGLYDEVTLHDPWGSPIVFMPREDPRIGMAPGDKFFFFSAGPDRKYLTRQDNLYSYEQPSLLPEH